MYKLINCEQGSEEWFQARLGKFTASVFGKVITKTGKLSSQSEDLINRLVAEKVLGEPDDTFKSDAMQRGNDLEQEALDFVNFTCGFEFEAVGFMDSGNGYGCSPDAVDEKNRVGLELKCPLPHTHLSYIANGGCPDKYKAQIQGSLLVSGFDKWIFCSYHPLIEGLVVEIERDEAYIEKLEGALIECCAKVQGIYNRLNKKMEL